MAYKFVGKSVPRLEGAEKVSGKTRYAADVEIPDALWAKLLRSPLPHARIITVDISKAAKLSGVRAVAQPHCHHHAVMLATGSVSSVNPSRP